MVFLLMVHGKPLIYHTYMDPSWELFDCGHVFYVANCEFTRPGITNSNGLSSFSYYLVAKIGGFLSHRATRNHPWLTYDFWDPHDFSVGLAKGRHSGRTGFRRCQTLGVGFPTEHGTKVQGGAPPVINGFIIQELEISPI